MDGQCGFTRSWVGSTNYGGVWLDSLLALNLIVGAWTLSTRTILTATLRSPPVALSRVVEAFVNLSLSIMLAGSCGLNGIALSTLVASLLTSCWIIPSVAAKDFRRSLSEFPRQTAASLLLLLLLLPLAWFVRGYAVSHDSIAGALLKTAITGAAGLAIYGSSLSTLPCAGER